MYNGQDVWLNDIPFNYTDDFGNAWIISDIDGWWGLPEVDAEEDARPYTQDGSYFTFGRYPSRNITVSGVIVPHSDASTDFDFGAIARDLLNNRLNIVRSLGLFRVNEQPDKIAAVQLVGRPLTKFDKPNNVLKFNFQLKASDPRKYSIDESVATASLSEPDSGRVYQRTYTWTYGGLSTGDNFIVDNVGSYDTPGLFTIRGPVTNPYIEHVDTGKTLRLNTVLGVSDFVTIDLNDRKIVLNGTASRKNLLDTRSQWFLIQPGINTLKYRGSQQIPATNGTPTLVNLLVNPAAKTAGGWTSEQFSGGNDYLVSRDPITIRRLGSVSVLVSGNPSSTYYATSVITGALRGIGTTGSSVPVTAGETYNFSVWANASNPGINAASIGADFYDGASGYLSTALTDLAVTAVADNWVRLSTTLLVPAGAVSAVMRASVSSPVLPGTPGITVRFADGMLVQGTTLYDYFDGSFSGAFWNGTADQSTSTQSAVQAVPQSVVEFRYRSAWIE